MVLTVRANETKKTRSLTRVFNGAALFRYSISERTSVPGISPCPREFREFSRRIRTAKKPVTPRVPVPPVIFDSAVYNAIPLYIYVFGPFGVRHGDRVKVAVGFEVVFLAA